MPKLALRLAAASTLALGGAAYAQSHSTASARTPMTPPASAATPATPAQPATPMTPPAQEPPMAAQPGQPATPATPANPAVPPQAAQSAPPATASVATGMTLKDNTGATIGSITELKPDASGAQMATVKMGEDSFTVAASSLAVQNGAAVINLTQAQLQQMVHKPKS